MGMIIKSDLSVTMFIASCLTSCRFASFGIAAMLLQRY
jgi:hypothetical protein